MALMRPGYARQDGLNSRFVPHILVPELDHKDFPGHVRP
jgi:hypothetical protein